MRGRARLAIVGAAAVAAVVTTVATPTVASAAGPQLTRAPYVTDAVGGNATINWATDSPDAATVTFGTSSTGCTGSTAPGGRTAITVGTRTEYQWFAHLTGLAASTTYCYQISQDGVTLLPADPSFTSAASAGSSGPLTFAVLGDWGEATGGVNTDQANVLRRVAASGAQFVLGTGDIAYASGTQTQYGDLQNTGGNSEVFNKGFWGSPGPSMPTFNVLGNHGWNTTFMLNWPQDAAVSSSSGAYGADSSGNPTAWFAFDQGPARFYLLEAAHTSGYSADDKLHWAPGAAELAWLQNDLASHPRSLKFAVFHYPLFSDGATTGSDTALQRDLQPVLDQYGVNMAFNGHSHVYERNVPDAAGLVDYVSGGAGADTEALKSPCAATDAYAVGWSTAGSACGAAPVPGAEAQVHHFLLVTVNGLQVQVSPTDENGTVFDQQTYNFGPPASAPGTPTDLAATASDGAVSLSWSPPADDGGSSVTGYDVYRSTSAGSLGAVVARGVAATSYADTTVTNGTTYYYAVAARNAVGAGAASTQAQATPAGRPSAPAIGTATAGNAQATVTFSPPSTDGGSAVTHYTVTAHDATSSVNGGQTAQGAQSPIAVSGLVNGDSYTFTVTATNALGTSDPSASSDAVTPMTTPSAPASVGASTGNKKVTLTWSAPTSTGGGPVTGYDVYRSTSAGSRGSAVASLASATTFTDTSVVNGTTYYYSVTAVNAAGEGPASPQVSAVPHAGSSVKMKSAPASPTSSRTATFAFATDDPNGLTASTTCQLDSGSAAPCQSPVTYSGLADGTHVFVVDTSDGLGQGASLAYGWTVDATSPHVTVQAPGRPVAFRRLVTRWAGGDSGTGVSSYDVRYRRSSTARPFGRWLHPVAWRRIATTRVARLESAGFTDCFSVRARDRTGNVSAWTRPRCAAIPYDDRALFRSVGWARRAGASYLRGTVSVAFDRGAVLWRHGVTADQIAVVVTTCPSCGALRVYLAGRLVGIVRLRSARTVHRAVLVLPRFSRRSGTLRLRVTSSGRRVEIDGVVAARLL